MCQSRFVVLSGLELFIDRDKLFTPCQLFFPTLIGKKICHSLSSKKKKKSILSRESMLKSLTQGFILASF